MDADFKKRFLMDTDATGRFIITSVVTGRKYFVEPIDDNPEIASQWGDWEPGMKKYTGHYGKKHIGSVKSKDSLITTENGFEKIHNLKPGESPIYYANRLDREYQKKMEEKANGR